MTNKCARVTEREPVLNSVINMIEKEHFKKIIMS